MGSKSYPPKIEGHNATFFFQEIAVHMKGFLRDHGDSPAISWGRMGVTFRFPWVPNPPKPWSMACHSFHHPPAFKPLSQFRPPTVLELHQGAPIGVGPWPSKIPVDKNCRSAICFPAIPAITIGFITWPNHLCSGGEHVSQSVKPITSTSLVYFKAPFWKKIHGQIEIIPFYSWLLLLPCQKHHCDAPTLVYPSPQEIVFFLPVSNKTIVEKKCRG